MRSGRFGDEQRDVLPELELGSGERSVENCDVRDIVRTFREGLAVLRGSKFRVTAWGYSVVL